MTETADLRLSHFEIRTGDLAGMEAFYTRVLGFVVTDRGAAGPGQMVFLSRNESEHHQLVLAGTDGSAAGPGALDHIAFRVAALEALRDIHRRLGREPDASVQTVSHGTSWSVYFRDPDGNRLEVFVDTPWHVDQPVRFPVDLTLPDRELARATKEHIKDRAGFQPRETWFARLRRRLARDS